MKSVYFLLFSLLLSTQAQAISAASIAISSASRGHVSSNRNKCTCVTAEEEMEIRRARIEKRRLEREAATEPAQRLYERGEFVMPEKKLSRNASNKAFQDKLGQVRVIRAITLD